MTKNLSNCIRMCCALDGHCCGCCKVQVHGPACERGQDYSQFIFLKLGAIAAVHKAKKTKEAGE